MSYSNGSVATCPCGRLAIASCRRCGRTLCDEHRRTLPPAPEGISANALGRYELAIRLADGPHCEGCRADIGNYALEQINSAPRAPLPEHWLDRAIALSCDQSRSDEEKLRDAALPASLTAKDVAAEFLRRIERPAQEQVPVSPPKLMREPDYREGWSVDCRRTEYTVSGPGAGRYRLPCLVSVDGDLLGPALEEGDKPGHTWWIVPESEIELPLLVTGVALLLVLSAFMPPLSQAGQPRRTRKSASRSARRSGRSTWTKCEVCSSQWNSASGMSAASRRPTFGGTVGSSRA